MTVCTKIKQRRTSLLKTTGIMVLSGLLLHSSASQANVGSDYGFGPRSASLGGNSVSWNFDGFAAYNNPAGLPLINKSGTGFPEERFSVSYGIVYIDPQFTTIGNVVTQNSGTGGLPQGASPSSISGIVNTSYKPTFGQMLGAAWRADPEWYNFTLGITAFLPVDQLAYIDTGETFEPEYVLYRDRTQQPDISLAGALEVTNWLRFGFGVHVAYTLTSQADASINQGGAVASTARFQTILKPKLSPFFGIQISADDQASAGLVVRLPSSEDSSFEINTTAQAVGFLPSVPFAFVASSTIVYDPLSIQLGGSFKTTEDTRTYLQIDYDFWSSFQAPLLEIANPSSTAGLVLSPGPNIGYSYRNTLIPRIAEEFIYGTVKFRLGYAYQPGIINGPPDGIGNYLDPDKHLFNAGMGFIFQRFMGYHKPWNLDFSLDYQALVTQNVEKTPGDEAGNASNLKIGAPGYQAGGHVFGGEVALTLGL
jgi:long-subunit fatty acid transport protein